MLYQRFPRFELDLANTALQTPPLRVHFQVILELVLVAQHLVANLDGEDYNSTSDKGYYY